MPGATLEERLANLEAWATKGIQLNRRYQPGAGHLDLRPGFAALKRIGYDGCMTVECRILGPDKGRALAETARYVRALWDAV